MKASILLTSSTSNLLPLPTSNFNEFSILRCYNVPPNTTPYQLEYQLKRFLPSESSLSSNSVLLQTNSSLSTQNVILSNSQLEANNNSTLSLTKHDKEVVFSTQVNSNNTLANKTIFSSSSSSSNLSSAVSNINSDELNSKNSLFLKELSNSAFSTSNTSSEQLFLSTSENQLPTKTNQSSSLVLNDTSQFSSINSFSDPASLLPSPDLYSNSNFSLSDIGIPPLIKQVIPPSSLLISANDESVNDNLDYIGWRIVCNSKATAQLLLSKQPLTLTFPQDSTGELAVIYLIQGSEWDLPYPFPLPVKSTQQLYQKSNFSQNNLLNSIQSQQTIANSNSMNNNQNIDIQGISYSLPPRRKLTYPPLPLSDDTQQQQYTSYFAQNHGLNSYLNSSNNYNSNLLNIDNLPVLNSNTNISSSNLQNSVNNTSPTNLSTSYAQTGNITTQRPPSSKPLFHQSSPHNSNFSSSNQFYQSSYLNSSSPISHSTLNNLNIHYIPVPPSSPPPPPPPPVFPSTIILSNNQQSPSNFISQIPQQPQPYTYNKQQSPTFYQSHTSPNPPPPPPPPPHSTSPNVGTPNINTPNLNSANMNTPNLNSANMNTQNMNSANLNEKQSNDNSFVAIQSWPLHLHWRDVSDSIKVRFCIDISNKPTEWSLNDLQKFLTEQFNKLVFKHYQKKLSHYLTSQQAQSKLSNTHLSSPSHTISCSSQSHLSNCSPSHTASQLESQFSEFQSSNLVSPSNFQMLSTKEEPHIENSTIVNSASLESQTASNSEEIERSKFDLKMISEQKENSAADLLKRDSKFDESKKRTKISRFSKLDPDLYAKILGTNSSTSVNSSSLNLLLNSSYGSSSISLSETASTQKSSRFSSSEPTTTNLSSFSSSISSPDINRESNNSFSTTNLKADLSASTSSNTIPQILNTKIYNSDFQTSPGISLQNVDDTVQDSKLKGVHTLSASSIGINGTASQSESSLIEYDPTALPSIDDDMMLNNAQMLKENSLNEKGNFTETSGNIKKINNNLVTLHATEQSQPSANDVTPDKSKSVDLPLPPTPSTISSLWIGGFLSKNSLEKATLICVNEKTQHRFLSIKHLPIDKQENININNQNLSSDSNITQKTRYLRIQKWKSVPTRLR